jgi:hypothetical protein
LRRPLLSTANCESPTCSGSSALRAARRSVREFPGSPDRLGLLLKWNPHRGQPGLCPLPGTPLLEREEALFLRGPVAKSAPERQRRVFALERALELLPPLETLQRRQKIAHVSLGALSPILWEGQKATIGYESRVALRISSLDALHDIAGLAVEEMCDLLRSVLERHDQPFPIDHDGHDPEF